jgi:uncharacterized protein (DUF885 family)
MAARRHERTDDSSLDRPVPGRFPFARGCSRKKSRMKTRVLVLAPLLVLLACGDTTPTPAAPAPLTSSVAAPPQAAAPTADSKYEKIWSDFLAEYLRREPVQATSLGMHDYDGTWPDRSVAGDVSDRTFYESVRKELARLPALELSEEHRLDAEVLANALAQWTFDRDEMHSAETNPLVYVRLLGDGFDPLLTRTFAPASDRAKSLASRLSSVGTIVAAARARLAHPARIVTETAIKQNKGLLDLVDGPFTELLAQAPDQKDAVLVAAKQASTALHDFQTFLEGECLKHSDGDFRVGKDKLTTLLHLHLDSDVDPDDLVARARAMLSKTQDEMAQTAKELWPELMPKRPLPDMATPAARKKVVRDVLARLAEERPTNASIVADGTKLLGEATDFVKTHDLVGLPEEPCRVMEMPEYERGVAVAFCESSGPLEPKSETHVTISPTPADWPVARMTSFYREYNESMLADLMVHEAMPGHYLQAMHANKWKGSPRAIFTNGSFEEGWAVYGEWLMAKYGFGGPRVRMQRQKMMARVCANTILDHEIHAGTMDEHAAIALMENEAFQEEGEALGKWTRARISHGQLSTYFYGFSEFMELREAAEKKPGFDERAYHDQLLSFGTPSMREVRAAMKL